MSLRDRLRNQLVAARQMSERLLQDFRSSEDWTRQVCPGANHALWFVGHMGITDNFLISLLEPERSRSLDGFSEKFGMGSHPTSSVDAYPPVADVLQYMRERRAALLEVLDGFNDEDLSRRTPPGAPEFLSDFASVFEMANWHEWLHSGQLTVSRRSLGYRPLQNG